MVQRELHRVFIFYFCWTEDWAQSLMHIRTVDHYTAPLAMTVGFWRTQSGSGPMEDSVDLVDQTLNKLFFQSQVGTWAALEWWENQKPLPFAFYSSLPRHRAGFRECTSVPLFCGQSPSGHFERQGWLWGVLVYPFSMDSLLVDTSETSVPLFCGQSPSGCFFFF